MSDPEIYVEPRTARPWPQRLGAYRRLWWLAAAVFVLDRLTKLWVVHALPYNPLHDHFPDLHREVIPGFFYLIHVGNTGAAWSFLSGRSTLLAVLALGTLYALFHWRHALGLRAPAAQTAFGLACGGIVGNLVDRVYYKHVIDFIDLHFGAYVYPTFNVADSGICIGVILYIWMSWRAPRDQG